MPSSEYDLVYLRAGTQALQEYLLSREIYWAIGVTPPAGEPPYPQLTLGGLLLARARLMAGPRPPGVDTELHQLLSKLDGIQNQWRVAWEGKASREYHSRIALWSGFLNDYRTDPENHFDRYAFEVSRRVILQLLEPFATDLEHADRELLVTLDKFLREVLIPGGFIWDNKLADGFPRQVYWYLYGKLRS